MARIYHCGITRVEEDCVPITPQMITQHSINRRLCIIWMEVAITPFMVHSYPISREDIPSICSPRNRSLRILEIEQSQQQLLHFLTVLRQ